MRNIPVQSSMIQALAHDDDGTLHVTFANGRTYRYHNVPEDEVQALADASSVGKHFIDNIRDKYRAI